MNHTSQLRLVSIGYVVENKPHEDPVIDVTLAEMTSFLDGKIDSEIEDDTVTGVDPWGELHEYSIYTSNSLTATWYGDGTNRITPPDVRRGERVEIYQYSNRDKYYWKSITEPGLNTRKLEKVVSLYSNTQDEKDNELREDNSWLSEFNTRDKLVRIKTNKSDGEEWAYEVELDVKSGVFRIEDDIGNRLYFNSGEGKLELLSCDGGLVSLTRRDLKIDVDNLDISASSSFSLTTPKSTQNVEVSTLKGSEYRVDVGTTKWSGSKSYSSGTFTFNGDVVTKSDITNRGKSIGMEHMHIGVQSGTSQSGIVA